ncbi:hypothetical protein Busp01_45680 [Trinickia caryophylli]|nr:hypothetical protein Busp01_45680 [Trinickia caryophylli]
MIECVLLDEETLARRNVAALGCLIEVPHVTTGTKSSFVRAVHHDGKDVVIVAPFVEPRVHCTNHRNRKRVERLRAIQFDKTDSILDVAAHFVDSKDGNRF